MRSVFWAGTLVLVYFAIMRYIANMSTQLPTEENGRYIEQEIVGLFNELYKVLIRLGHFEEADVIWPPSDGHTLDLSLLQYPDRIDSRVVSLMTRLPLTRKWSQKLLAPCTRPVNYLDPVAIVRSRDVDKRDYWASSERSHLDETNALPTVLSLLDGEESPDASLVLEIGQSRFHLAM